MKVRRRPVFRDEIGKGDGDLGRRLAFGDPPALGLGDELEEARVVPLSDGSGEQAAGPFARPWS
jgi:hypothetical protein